MLRRLTIAVVAVIAVLTVAGTALAGGWALTRIDDAPATFEANTTYQVEYTILQHGKTAVDVSETSLTFVHPDMKQPLTFSGERGARTGHYVAEVTLPIAGSWEWRVAQGWFGEQELGTVEAVTLLAAPTTGVNVAGVALSLVTLAVLAFFVAQIVGSRRQLADPMHAE